MREFSLHLLVAALISAGPINAEPRCADLALVLAIDSSSSIDKDEFQMQVLGYAAAFADPKVLRALGDAGTVDLASVFWADSAIPPMVTKWTRISSNADAEAFADTFLVRQRSAFGNTELGAGLMAALDLLEVPGQCSARSVVNVSGDGRASVGDRRAAHTSVAEARVESRRDGRDSKRSGHCQRGAEACRVLPDAGYHRAGGLRDGGAGFPRLRRCHRAEAGT